MTPLGAKLRQLREERGVTLKDMAKSLRVSSAYLSALEHGKRGKPTWILLQRIITYFNVIWDEAEELQRLAEISDPRVTMSTLTEKVPVSIVYTLLVSPIVIWLTMRDRHARLST